MRRFSGHRRRCHWPGRHSPSLDAGVPRLSPASSLDSACGLTSCVRSLGESRLLGTARGAATLGVTRSGPQHSDGNLQTLSPFVTSLICQMGLCRSAGQFRTAARARGSPIPGRAGPIPGSVAPSPGMQNLSPGVRAPSTGVWAPSQVYGPRREQALLCRRGAGVLEDDSRGPSLPRRPSDLQASP